MVKKERKKKVNKYANASEPQAVFDFHGKGVLLEDDIQHLASTFIEKCCRKGYSRVLIVTGKGLHSRNGAVVGPFLKSFLPSLSGVRQVVFARRDRGGDGALEVLLL